MPRTVGHYRRPTNYAGRPSYVQMAKATVWAARKAKRMYASYSRSDSKQSYAKPKAAERKSKARRSRARHRGSKVKRTLSKCCASIKELQREAKSDLGTQITRLRSSGRSLCVVNSVVHTSVYANTNTIMEQAGSNLKYLDPSNPTSLDDVDVDQGIYAHPTNYSVVYNSLKVANNYKIPVNCTVYCMVPKKDTNKSVATSFSDGLADVGNPSISSPLVYVTDSPVFQSLWKIKKKVNKRLLPGEQLIISNSEKNVTYKPSLVDVHSDTYQPSHAACIYFIRNEGALAHDDTSPDTDSQGRTRGGVDWELNQKYIIKYAAGREITNITVTDTSDLPVNTGCVSAKPAAAQQAFSVLPPPPPPEPEPEP